jgi:hypothetical protein
MAAPGQHVILHQSSAPATTSSWGLRISQRCIPGIMTHTQAGVEREVGVVVVEGKKEV